jgi:SAM-dependent methyltransferase
VDIERSAEVEMRTRGDADFHTFDGERLPFGDAEFDLVWCKQVLEHAENPRALLADVARVLRSGGVLIGSTSQLEPFHSRSTANPTPYGLTLALEEAGLHTTAIRPSIDSLTLIVRRAVGGGALFDRWWAHESPVNRAIDLYARVRRMEPAAVSAAKLVLCGQFVFAAERPAGGSAGQAEA